MARTEELWTNGINQTYIQTSSPSGYDLLINGSNHYINFNAITGSSGYGFRDNGGVMEWKDSGGTWAAFGSGGGGMAIGGTVTGGTPKSVLYVGAGGVLAQDNANFQYDSSLGYLGIGTTPQARLDVREALVASTLNLHAVSFMRPTSTFNTSATARTNYVLQVSNQSTRASGAFDLTNVGLYATASGGQKNYSILYGGHIMADSDNAYDIGGSGVLRPRTGYFGTSVISPLFNGVALTTGGSATKYLSEDGTYTTPGGGSGITIGTTTITSGTDKRILFNDGGVVGDDAGFTWDKTYNNLTIEGGAANLTTLPMTGLKFTGDANLPMQTYAYDHDNMVTIYDGWYDKAAGVLKSSWGGSTFGLVKNLDKVRWAGTVGTVGSTVAFNYDLWTLDVNGNSTNLGTLSSGGNILPITDGTPSLGDATHRFTSLSLGSTFPNGGALHFSSIGVGDNSKWAMFNRVAGNGITLYSVAALAYRFTLDEDGAFYIGGNAYPGMASTIVGTNAGRVGIGIGTPDAWLNIKAGTASASTAPLKFTSGTSLTTAEAGAMEFTTDDLFFTITTGAARKRLLMADPVGGLTSGRVPFATTNGRLIDNASLTYDQANNLITLSESTYLNTIGFGAISGTPYSAIGTLKGGAGFFMGTGVTSNTGTNNYLTKTNSVSDTAHFFYTRYDRGLEFHTGATGSPGDAIADTSFLRWSMPDAGHFIPGTDATYDIGTSTVGINDLHFGLAGIINFDGGDVTLTHSAGLLIASKPILKPVLVEANTAGSGAPNLITAAESGTTFTNEGSTAQNYHTLPTAVAGLIYTFYVDDADGIRIVANTGDLIQINGIVSSSAGYCESTAIGSSITLTAINATDWVAISVIGTWTLA